MCDLSRAVKCERSLTSGRWSGVCLDMRQTLSASWLTWQAIEVLFILSIFCSLLHCQLRSVCFVPGVLDQEISWNNPHDVLSWVVILVLNIIICPTCRAFTQKNNFEIYTICLAWGPDSICLGLSILLYNFDILTIIGLFINSSKYNDWFNLWIQKYFIFITVVVQFSMSWSINL